MQGGKQQQIKQIYMKGRRGKINRQQRKKLRHSKRIYLKLHKRVNLEK